MTQPRIQLRRISVGDLPRIFEIQSDRASNELAATIARDEATFQEHWVRVLDDGTVSAYAIDADGELVGTISRYPVEGTEFVGYWIAREHWNRGIASAALRRFLELDGARPLHARVAVDNVGSVRVLEKCGFRETHREWSEATDRFLACEEVWLRLDANPS